MKLRKQLLSLVLGGALIISALAGCSSDNKNDKFDSTQTPQNVESVNIQGSSKDFNTWIYLDPTTNIMYREAVFDSGLGGEPVTIAQLSDLHFNYINKQDREENNPSIMSTYSKRKWVRGGTSARKAANCLKAVADFDQIVITGDVLDYLSWGAIELMQKNIWDKYPDTLICLGNHESSRVCEGEVEDTTTLESRLEILKSVWKHDIFYTSKIIKEKVMVIQMDNASDSSFAGKFWECQIEPLTKDLELAREKGYTVLIFYHIPIATNNTAQGVVAPIRGNAGEVYFANWGTSHKANDASTAVYNIIVNNADIIKGTFCGHFHSDYYTEIVGKTPEGKEGIIPQYILTGIPFDEGHVLKITVK